MHKRKDRYWRLYDFANYRDLSEAVDKLVRLVDETQIAESKILKP